MSRLPAILLTLVPVLAIAACDAGPDLTAVEILALEAKDAGTLARILASRDIPESRRSVAALAAGRFGPEARECGPVLRELLGEGTLKFRMGCAFALWQVEGDTEATVPVLLQGLQESDPVLSGIALFDLGRMGEAALGAAAALRRLVADESADADTRARAAEALWRVGGDPEEVVPVLIELLSAPDARRSAAAALGPIGLPHAAGAVVRIEEVLDGDVPPRVRTTTAWALGRLGGEKRAVRELMAVAGNEDAETNTRRWSIYYLADLGADAEPALPLLVRIEKTGPPVLSLAAKWADLVIRNRIAKSRPLDRGK